MGRTVRNQRSDWSPLPRVNVRKLEAEAGSWKGLGATMLALDTAEYFDIVDEEEGRRSWSASGSRTARYEEDWYRRWDWRDAQRGARGCDCRLGLRGHRVGAYLSSATDPAERVVDCGGAVCGTTEEDDDWLPPARSWRNPDLETEIGECGICTERETLLRTGCGSYSFRSDSYGPHRFCGDCLKGWIGSKLNDSCVLIKCPHEGCKETLTFASIERIAGPETFDRFLALAERDYTAKSDEILKDPLLSKWAEDHMKQCPNCRQLVERSEGCAHISCVCGADWCFNCEQFLEDCGDGCYDSDDSDGDDDDDEDYDPREELDEFGSTRARPQFPNGRFFRFYEYVPDQIEHWGKNAQGSAGSAESVSGPASVSYPAYPAYNDGWMWGELTDLALVAKEQRDRHTSSAISAKFRRQQRQGKKAGSGRQDRGMAGGGRKTSQRNWSVNTVPRVHRMRLAAGI